MDKISILTSMKSTFFNSNLLWKNLHMSTVRSIKNIRNDMPSKEDCLNYLNDTSKSITLTR